MRIVNPEKEDVCVECGTHMMYTKDDILYQYRVDSWIDSCEIDGYVICPKCGNAQFVGTQEYGANMSEDEFNRKYAGRIYRMSDGT